jgi:hypothetical protein
MDYYNVAQNSFCFPQFSLRPTTEMDFGSRYVYIFMADAPYFYIQATNVVKNTKRATEFWKKKKKLFDYLFFFVCLKFARLNGVSISSFYMRSCCSRPRKRATTVKTDGRVDANAGESSASSQGNSCKSFLFFSRERMACTNVTKTCLE